MRSPLFCSMIVAASAMAGTLHAAPPAEIAARARQIAPFLDEQTIAVVCIDIGRIDVKLLADRLAGSAWFDRSTLDWLSGGFQSWSDDFRKAGGREIFVMISLADVPEKFPYFVVPLARGANEAALADLLKRIGVRNSAPLFDRCTRRGDALIAGQADVLARVAGATPAPRPQLEAALEAAGDSPLQLLLLPSDDHRRVAREMLWQSLDHQGPALGSVLAEGLRWSALALDLPPNTSLRWIVQSSDQKSAVNLLALLNRSAGEWSRSDGVRETLPNAEEILKRLIPAVKGDRLQVTLDVDNQNAAPLVAALWPALERTRRRQAVSHLKEIILALHNYHDAFSGFPAQANYDKQGKPLLSWRVHILPYLGEGPLYNEFRLDEPWDSPHNRKLIDRMPRVYTNGNLRLIHEGRTTFLAPIGDRTGWGIREGIEIKDFSDGTSNTILLVTANDDRAVVWTKPADWDLDSAQPKRGLFGNSLHSTPVGLADGSIRTLFETIKSESLQALFTRNAEDIVGEY